MLAKRQQHFDQVAHNREVQRIAESEVANIHASTRNSPESILAMQKQRRDELLRAGNTDRARYYDALIAQQQAKVEAIEALKQFESSDEFTSTMEVVGKVRPLIAQYTPDNLVQHDAAIEVYRQTGDQDRLFSTIARLSNAATLAESMARREQAAKLSEQQRLLSQATAEQLAASKANDEMIAAAKSLQPTAEAAQ